MSRTGRTRRADQTEQVVRLVHDVLGTDVVGVYAHGSAVRGGLRPHSDIDVLAVVRSRTTAALRRALVDGLLTLSGGGADTVGGAGGGGAGGARPVELTVVVASDVRPWRYPPLCEFQYGEWLREAYERGETPAPGPDPDLAVLITAALRGDAPLAGPPPAEVLDPVPHDDLRRAVADGVPELLAELASDTRNVLLTLARIWLTLTTGEIRPKDAAADWALTRLPAEHRAVLAHARAVYLGAETERWDGLLPRVRAHAAYVVTEIERRRPRPR
ncbi:aminoglycoside nucleotidyltransferase ANT9 [Streptomyces sp. NRRL F-5135]|uniref:aminoglycoside nucleotidyltransferase ANT9 n=1 Tax=Streptomyces sp. NRRL F-5135 TaxID=1463858 RepID=UPI000569F346|nr:aminoglycoside nucleotidyltransferase ANT9 [Streptomyces sp. NRRL F-5135]